MYILTKKVKVSADCNSNTYPRKVTVTEYGQTAVKKQRS